MGRSQCTVVYGKGEGGEKVLIHVVATSVNAPRILGTADGRAFGMMTAPFARRPTLQSVGALNT